MPFVRSKNPFVHNNGKLYPALSINSLALIYLSRYMRERASEPMYWREFSPSSADTIASVSFLSKCGLVKNTRSIMSRGRTHRFQYWPFIREIYAKKEVNWAFAFCEQASFDISVEFLRYMLHVEAHVTWQICEIIINFFQLVVGSSKFALCFLL